MAEGTVTNKKAGDSRDPVVSFLAQVIITAANTGEAAEQAREKIDKATGAKIALDGFRLTSHDEPCPHCERTQREIVGFAPGKMSTVIAAVSLQRPKKESFDDFRKRLLDAAKKSDDVTIFDVKDGS